jgi:3-mercaptopyruvate sulfurtransferase SseA
VTGHLAGPLPADGSGPLVSAEWLGRHLAEAVVLDATVDMPSPRTDGDYRVASGRAGWLAEHIPGSRHADCGGISAALLALVLTVLGIGDVAIYDGSLEEWTADPPLPVQAAP